MHQYQRHYTAPIESPHPSNTPTPSVRTFHRKECVQSSNRSPAASPETVLASTECGTRALETAYRDTSLIRNRPPLRPYSSIRLGPCGGHRAGGLFLMSEVTLYPEHGRANGARRARPARCSQKNEGPDSAVWVSGL